MNNEIAPETSASWQVPTFDTLLWLGQRQPWCIVIPVINEGERIGKLLDRMANLGIQNLADILIIDGGSTDGSLNTTTLQNQGVRGLLVKTGPGKLSAQLRCAYAFALDQSYAGIVTIDGNNKDDPEAIPRFINALQDGMDFVQASRYIPGGVGENTPKLREMAIRWVHAPLLSLCSGFHWTDTTRDSERIAANCCWTPRWLRSGIFSRLTNCWPICRTVRRSWAIAASNYPPPVAIPLPAKSRPRSAASKAICRC